MKFNIPSKQLLTRLNAVSKVISNKNAYAILDNFLFELEGERLVITGSDMETRMTTTIDVPGAEGNAKFAIDVNVAYEARSSKCLITDYSSAACDFAYLGKPVIYANFDMDHIYDVHYYNKGYFDYDVHGFGPNCKTKEEVIGYILRLLDNGFQPEEEYAKRMEAFFYYRDANNADRVYEEIRKLDHRLHG